MVGISHWKQLWHSIAMCRRPAVPPASRAISRSAPRSSGRVASASCSRRRPALVKRRLGLAEQRHAQALFQLLELVGQRRLRQVQAFGGFHQAVGSRRACRVLR
jgi:hypothetical protein